MLSRLGLHLKKRGSMPHLLLVSMQLNSESASADDIYVQRRNLKKLVFLMTGPPNVDDDSVAVRGGGIQGSCGGDLASEAPEAAKEDPEDGRSLYIIFIWGPGEFSPWGGQTETLYTSVQQKTLGVHPFQSAYHGWSVPTKECGYFTQVYLSLSHDAALALLASGKGASSAFVRKSPPPLSHG